MLRSASPWKIGVVSVVLFAQLALHLVPAVAYAQTSPPKTTTKSGAAAPATRPPVDRGQEYYEQSRFDEAIGLLKDLVDRGQLAGADLERARELLARSYVKKGYPVQAKEMFKGILRENPGYRPDPIRVPPDETAVFEQALKEYESERAAAAPPPATGTPPPAGGIPPAAATAAGAGAGATAGTAVKKSGGKTWLWVGLGVLAAGGLALALGGGGGDDGETPPASVTLGGFPAPPTP
jgi:hypothetical protein